MVASPTRFSDITSHWARLFIEGLAQRNIVRGFPDQTFRPNQSMSRAEFAAILQTAFTRPTKRPYVSFVDVSASHWAAAAIRKAYETGFISGYPDQRFRPDDKITRSQVLTALVSGLGLTSPFSAEVKAALPKIYRDSAQIPDYAVEPIAIATDAQIVVNHPTLQLINPQQPATRAEVAAFIYQALVSQEQLPPVPSDYIVRYVPTVSVSHAREFRGVWISSIWNIDWPTATAVTVQQQQAELITILDRMQDLNLNALVLQVRAEGDALYASQLEPWSAWLTGTQGKAPEPFYDPLQFAIAQCRQRSIEIHAWFNPYRAKAAKPNVVNVAPHIAVTNPEVVYPWGNELWMDPGAQVVQDRAYNVILDVVRRYDIDGIHLDDYFYPYPIAGQNFPDAKTYQAYQANGGTLSLNDWRRDNVNRLVQRLAVGIRAAKPHVKFGISPFGIYRPGQPPQVRGLDAYDQLYADALKWVQEGWLDYLSPQLYWRIEPPAQSYPVLLQWWAENNPKQRHIYPGNNLGQLDGQKWTLEEIEQQVAITRSRTAQQVLGNIFFSMKAFTQNRVGINDRLKSSIYTKPVLAPAISWLTAPAPPLPQLRVKAGKLTWQPASAEIRAWTLYKQNGNTWELVQILSAATTEATVNSPGIYALCGVNRLWQESLGVKVAVR